jgi:hypothetical protein
MLSGVKHLGLRKIDLQRPRCFALRAQNNNNGARLRYSVITWSGMLPESAV